jgi:hypothetical protein
MDDNENDKPKGILFLLADGTEWAFMRPREEMIPRGVLGLDDESEEEDLLPEVKAHFIKPDSDRLH